MIQTCEASITLFIPLAHTFHMRKWERRDENSMGTLLMVVAGTGMRKRESKGLKCTRPRQTSSPKRLARRRLSLASGKDISHHYLAFRMKGGNCWRGIAKKKDKEKLRRCMYLIHVIGTHVRLLKRGFNNLK